MPIEIDEYRIPFVGEALLKAEKKGKAEGTTLGITKAFEIQKRLRAGETDLEALARKFDLTLAQVRYIQQHTQA